MCRWGVLSARAASSDRSRVFAEHGGRSSLAEHTLLVLLNRHGLLDLKGYQDETARGALQSLVPSEDGPQVRIARLGQALLVAPSGSQGALVEVHNFLLEFGLCFGSDLAAALEGAIEVAEDLVWEVFILTQGFTLHSGWRLQRDRQDKDLFLISGKRALAKRKRCNLQKWTSDERVACLERKRHFTLSTCGGKKVANPVSLHSRMK